MDDFVRFARKQAEACLEQERKTARHWRSATAYLGNPSMALQWLQVAELLAASPGGAPNGQE